MFVNLFTCYKKKKTKDELTFLFQKQNSFLIDIVYKDSNNKCLMFTYTLH